ncbi:M24 family metallopeptidase, partial [Nitrospinota bacterium]
AMNIFGTSFDYEGRLRKVRRMMDERDIDCLIVHKWPNQYYISGHFQHLPWYPHTSHLGEAPLIVFRDSGEDPVFLCAHLSSNYVREGTWVKDVRAFDKDPGLSVYEYIAEVLKEKGIEGGNIGIEEDCCTINTFWNLQEVLPRAQFKKTSEIFDLARVVKEPEEIQLIKESVAIGEAALEVAIEAAKPGVTEMEVQTAAEMEMKRRGAIREVETMCQSGTRTTIGRAFASALKKIEKNDLVLVDLGCVYKGYGCDMTRTWVVGKPTAEQKKIAGDLYKVHEKVLGFIKPGLKYHEVTDFAREELLSAGYQTNKHSFPFQRVAFHGIGLGPFHDPPDAHYKDMVLESGMTLSTLPCVHHEKFTIRFEDNIVLTPNGLELMTKLPKELI